MATKTSFVQGLLDITQRKRADLVGLANRKIDEENTKRLNAYTSTPEFLELKELATKLLGKDESINLLGLGSNIPFQREARYRSDEFKKLVGFQGSEGYDYAAVAKMDALLTGALTTTSIKFWTGLFTPIDDFLKNVEAATTQEQLDEAVMTLVLQLR